MPEYFRPYNFPSDITSKRMEVESQTPNLGAEIIKQLGNVGTSYFKEKKDKREKEKKEKIDVDKETQSHLAAIVKEGMFEVDTEKLEEDPSHIEKAIKSWIPYEKRSKVASVNAKNQPADPIRIKTLEAMVNAYNRQNNPEAGEYSVDKSITHTAEAIDNEIARYTKASGITEQQALKMAEQIPSSSMRKASEEATKKASQILTAQPQQNANMGYGGVLDLPMESDDTKLIDKAKTTVIPETGLNVYESIKRSPLKKEQLITVISKKLSISTIEAEKLHNIIRPIQ